LLVSKINFFGIVSVCVQHNTFSRVKSHLEVFVSFSSFKLFYEWSTGLYLQLHEASKPSCKYCILLLGIWWKFLEEICKHSLLWSLVSKYFTDLCNC